MGQALLLFSTPCPLLKNSASELQIASVSSPGSSRQHILSVKGVFSFPLRNVDEAGMKVSLSVLVIWWWLGSASADHSIMEMIDHKRVEKMLTNRKLGSAKEPSGPTPFTHNALAEDSIVEDDLSDTHSNAVTKHGRRGHHAAIPDISTVLSELSRSDKLLKSEQPGMLVTKKELVRKDWCRTEPILQKIREEGCTPKNVVNRFCYGQCNSFFIPKNLSTRRVKNENSPAFRSCGVCKPKKMVWVQVTLICPGMDPPLRRRRVQKVKHCHCMAENVVF